MLPTPGRDWQVKLTDGAQASKGEDNVGQDYCHPMNTEHQQDGNYC